MKRALCALLLLAIPIMMFGAPAAGSGEDPDTLLLARTLYALGHNESYDTLLALGTVVMNRVDNPWYPKTVGAVLTQQHQFAYGTRYDERTLRAAREVIAGTRTLPADVLRFESADASAKLDGVPMAQVGGYEFFSDIA